MKRHLLTFLAALSFSCGSALWAEDPAPTTVTTPSATAPAAAAETKKELTPDEKAMAELIEKAKIGRAHV